MEAAIPITSSTHRRRDGRLIVIGIGIIKLLKASLLLLFAIAAIALTRDSVADYLWRWASELDVGPLRGKIGDFVANKLLNISSNRLVEAAIGCTLYAILFYVEGIGLLLNKLWAEWVVVISTSLLIPVEIYEIHAHWPDTLPLAALLLNVAIVLFLIFRVRRRIREHHAANALTPN